MVEYYDFTWFLTALDTAFGRVSGVWFAWAFLPPFAVLAAWARRPRWLTGRQFLYDLETWNFGLPWTQAGVISTFITGSQLAASLQVPSETPTLLIINASKSLKLQLEAEPTLFRLVLVGIIFFIMVGTVFLQITSLHKLRESRLELEAMGGDRVTPQNVPLWAVRTKRIIWFSIAWLIGFLAVFAAYMLNRS